MARTVLAVIVLAAAGGIGSMAAPDPAVDLSGVYRCSGTSPDGTSYEGVVEIAKLRDTFRVRWTLEDGSIMGVGIYSEGVFAVSYFGGAPAVAVYKVDGDRLIGHWTMGGVEGQMYGETLTKVGEAPLTPLYPATPQRLPSAPASHRLPGAQV